jgi:hypothetical protein
LSPKKHSSSLKTVSDNYIEVDFLRADFRLPPVDFLARVCVREAVLLDDFLPRVVLFPRVDVDLLPLREETALFFLPLADFRPPLLFFGTLAPSARASDKPIAIACLRLVTVLPLPPLFNWPRFLSCMALSTLSCAFFEYLGITKNFGDFLGLIHATLIPAVGPPFCF